MTLLPVVYWLLLIAHRQSIQPPAQPNSTERPGNKVVNQVSCYHMPGKIKPDVPHVLSRQEKSKTIGNRCRENPARNRNHAAARQDIDKRDHQEKINQECPDHAHRYIRMVLLVIDHTRPGFTFHVFHLILPLLFCRCRRHRIKALICKVGGKSVQELILSGCIFKLLVVNANCHPGKTLPAKNNNSSDNGADNPFFHNSWFWFEIKDNNNPCLRQLFPCSCTLNRIFDAPKTEICLKITSLRRQKGFSDMYR